MMPPPRLRVGDAPRAPKRWNRARSAGPTVRPPLAVAPLAAIRLVHAIEWTHGSRHAALVRVARGTTCPSGTTHRWARHRPARRMPPPFAVAAPGASGLRRSGAPENLARSPSPDLWVRGCCPAGGPLRYVGQGAPRLVNVDLRALRARSIRRSHTQTRRPQSSRFSYWGLIIAVTCSSILHKHRMLMGSRFVVVSRCRYGRDGARALACACAWQAVARALGRHSTVQIAAARCRTRSTTAGHSERARSGARPGHSSSQSRSTNPSSAMRCR